MDYALLHSAIIVTGDYRLIPESNGLDIIEDLSDFWSWIRKDFKKQVTLFRAGIEVDLSKIIVQGESAGGHLALQSGFLQAPGYIKAVIAVYPGLGFDREDDHQILGSSIIPKSILEEHLKGLVPGKIVTSAIPPDRFPIALSIMQQKRKAELFGTDDRLLPLKTLQKIDVAPFTLLLHGKDDTAVPIEYSIKLQDMMKKRFGDSVVDLVIRPGEHGFDLAMGLDEPWLNQALRRVTELWLHE